MKRTTPPDIDSLLKTKEAYKIRLVEKLGYISKSAVLFILMCILKDGIKAEEAKKSHFQNTITLNDIYYFFSMDHAGGKLEKASNCCTGDLNKAWYFLVTNGYLNQLKNGRYKANIELFRNLFNNGDFES